jgi:hypothetical protein
LVERMNAVDCCSSRMHLCTCNGDDGCNTTAQRYLDANYAFPIRLGKGDAHGECIHQSGTLRVAVQGIRIVALVPNYKHYEAVVMMVAVPSLLLALSAVAALRVVPAAVAVPVHQHLQSDQIGFVLLTSCQVELAVLMAS